MLYSEYYSISPIDGRYKEKTKELRNYFNDFSLSKYRVMVEIEYFISLTNILPQLSNISEDVFVDLRKIYKNFDIGDAVGIKKIENSINHDVKAVEYYLRDKFDILKLDRRYKEFIHFGLTSQDINNTAFPSMIKNGMYEVYLPNLIDVRSYLFNLGMRWKDIPMLSRTHGQPATPTRLGKEIMVFVERLDEQIINLKMLPHTAKFGGAVGNFNAHHVAYPQIDWKLFADRFVASIGLQRQQNTTQIEHYDCMSSIFQCFSRINTILIDLCRDLWEYISLDYLVNVPIEGEIGSSVMPHKVNPINFENAEGNFGIANAIFSHFSQKLPVSRLQRDLTDSTVLRSIGVPIGHSLIGFKSIVSGLKKLKTNPVSMEIDLEKNWVVVTEAIQTILRREGVTEPYLLLKNLSRGKQVSKKTISEFVEKLNVPVRVKDEIRKITPYNYIGI